MQTQSDFNFEDFKKEAIKGMYAGKPLNGEKGIFAPLLKHFLEAALAGEMDSHLQESKQQGERNRRNGKVIKRVKSLSGERPTPGLIWRLPEIERVHLNP